MPEWVKRLNNDRTIIILGRGHSGTRAIAKLLRVNGVFMGEPRNIADDLMFPPHLWEASKEYHRENKVTDRGLILLREFLQSVINSKSEFKGWKRPITMLIFPLLCEILPNAKYIWWTRHINESISQGQSTDDLFDLLGYHTTKQESWNYMNSIVANSNKPPNFLHVKFEDFLLDNSNCISKISKFTGIDLKPIIIDSSKAYYGNYYVKDTSGYVDRNNTETLRLLKYMGYENA